MNSHIDIVFDGPPGSEGGRFIEVEDEHGRSIRLGEWVERVDGYWVLRVTRAELVDAVAREVDCEVVRADP